MKSLPQIHQASVLVCPSHRPEEKIKEKRKSFISTGCSVWEAEYTSLLEGSSSYGFCRRSVTEMNRKWKQQKSSVLHQHSGNSVSRFNIQDSSTDNCPQIKNTYIRTEQIKPLWQFLQKLVAKLRATQSQRSTYDINIKDFTVIYTVLGHHLGKNTTIIIIKRILLEFCRLLLQ